MTDKFFKDFVKDLVVVLYHPHAFGTSDNKDVWWLCDWENWESPRKGEFEVWEPTEPEEVEAFVEVADEKSGTFNVWSAGLMFGEGGD